MFIVSLKTFNEYKLACSDLCSWIINNNGEDTYDYDNQSIEYEHLKTIINSHYPNNSFRFDDLLNYFANKGVLIGFCPHSLNNEASSWSAVALSANKVLICNDFYNWRDAQTRCIKYGFQILNEIITNKQS